MKTKLTLIDGEECIVEGRPRDFMQLIYGMGISKNSALQSITGKKITMADIFMLEQVKE
ncbi:hypothetical protein [Sporosarcina sp. FSL W7-1283]|uniref:hypothetical protein n=1 Tax=Sporosarcina sp. FSL W7-1283 TaxID=2921560 RepID=UPI0030F81C25